MRIPMRSSTLGQWRRERRPGDGFVVAAGSGEVGTPHPPGIGAVAGRGRGPFDDCVHLPTARLPGRVRCSWSSTGCAATPRSTATTR